MRKPHSLLALTFWSVLTAIALWCLDRAMRLDAEHLCSNDATAYAECSQ